MSKLKSVMNFFVTIEGDEDDEVPEEAASEDEEVAVKAARARVENGPPVGHPSNSRVRDHVDPYAGTIDESALPSGPPSEAGDGMFDDVYHAAGLPSSTDPAFTIFKVERLLNSQHLAGLGDKAKAASVLVALEAHNVGLTSVIADAVARDKALDQYDQMLSRDVKNMQTEVEIANATIETDIEEFLMSKREEMAANNAKLAEFKQLYARWFSKKREEEDRLFAAITPFVNENPITRDD